MLYMVATARSTFVGLAKCEAQLQVVMALGLHIWTEFLYVIYADFSLWRTNMITSRTTSLFKQPLKHLWPLHSESARFEILPQWFHCFLLSFQVN